MKISTLLLLYFLASMSAYAQRVLIETGLAGDAKCEWASERGPCTLVWSGPGFKHNTVLIQQFSTASQGWDNIGSPLAANTKASPTPVVGGALYRVAFCDENAKGRDRCLGTKVYWVPALPESLDEVPKEIRFSGGDGAYMVLDHAEGLATVTQDLNVGLMTNFINTVDDMFAMPPMTQRSVEHFDFVSDKPTTKLEVLEWIAYRDYEMARTGCFKNVETCPFATDPRPPRH